MNLIRQMVRQGLNIHGILLDPFVFKAEVVETSRLPGWWEWPGRRLK